MPEARTFVRPDGRRFVVGSAGEQLRALEALGFVREP
jgi:hypothetical protein